MSTEDRIAYIAVTRKGKELAQKLKGLMGQGDIYITSKLQGEDTKKQENQKTSKEFSVIEDRLGIFMKQLFKEYDYLICIMATGIVVRSIAPYIESKLKDPAVLVLDEQGEYVISLLSGHMGGANRMAKKISELLDAHPVITTATDVNKKAALDCIIKDLNAYTKTLRESVKAVNYGLVHDEKIGLYIKGDYEIDERGFIRLDGLDEEILKRKLNEMDQVVYISHKAGTCIWHEKLIKVVPRRFVLGIGCKKHTSAAHMLEAFESYMRKHKLDPHSIALIGSIELKKDEEAIKVLAKKLEVPFRILSKEAILEVEGIFQGSSFVKQNIGVACVAEPAAYLLGDRKIILPKEKYEGITFALGVVANTKGNQTD